MNEIISFPRPYLFFIFKEKRLMYIVNSNNDKKGFLLGTISYLKKSLSCLYVYKFNIIFNSKQVFIKLLVLLQNQNMYTILASLTLSVNMNIGRAHSEEVFKPI